MGFDWSWLPLAILIVAIVVDFAVRVLSIIFVPRNRRPQTATAWLLAIFFLPYIGILLFWLIGSRYLPKKRREKQYEINSYILETTEGMDLVRQDKTWPNWLPSVVALNRTLGAMPMVGGNRATLHDDYDESLIAMTNALRTARRYVHAEFYILNLDKTSRPFFDELAAAIQRGVTVRVLIDHIACLRSTNYRGTIRRLTEMGADWHLMLPIQPFKGKFQRPDLRNHRKILIIDGEVGFTGSQNVIDASYDKRSNLRRGLRWKDLMVRFEGPIVAGINALFVTDWYSETDELLVREVENISVDRSSELLDAQVVPSGPGFDGENNLRLFNSLIYSAKKQVIITTPYFVPDESMLYAITTAAQSGIEVQLFVSEIGDQAITYHAQRSYYEELLRAGVRIWQYQSPTILHAKHITIDDQVAVIGSSNMDMRSFSLDLEITVMVKGSQFVQSLRRVEDSYRMRSRELTLTEWMRRPTRSKVLDNIARLTAAVQ
ncbi:MAG TPA: cardiolipin synthase [Galbitalea sp.]